MSLAEFTRQNKFEKAEIITKGNLLKRIKFISSADVDHPSKEATLNLEFMHTTFECRGGGRVTIIISSCNVIESRHAPQFTRKKGGFRNSEWV